MVRILSRPERESSSAWSVPRIVPSDGPDTTPLSSIMEKYSERERIISRGIVRSLILLTDTSPPSVSSLSTMKGIATVGKT